MSTTVGAVLQRLRHPRPAALLLWAALLLATQVAATAHLHAEPLADSACVACSLGAADPAPCHSHPPAPPAPACEVLQPAADAAAPLQARVSSRLPRGPPRD